MSTCHVLGIRGTGTSELYFLGSIILCFSEESENKNSHMSVSDRILLRSISRDILLCRHHRGCMQNWMAGPPAHISCAAEALAVSPQSVLCIMA